MSATNSPSISEEGSGVPTTLFIRGKTALNALAADTSLVLLVLAGACVVVLLLVIIILGRRSRAPRSRPGAVDAGHELAEISRRLASLDGQVAQIAGAVPHFVQGIGVVRYNPFPGMGGNISFSLALVDGQANGVVISVLNDRTGSRVYGKAVEKGTSLHTLSDEEKQALTQALGNHP